MKRRLKTTMGLVLGLAVPLGVGGYLAHRELVGTASFDASFYAAAAEPAARGAPFV
ncbi:MAG: hypothetical protein ACOCXX_05595 [Planctomycetota bacterium]